VWDSTGTTIEVKPGWYDPSGTVLSFPRTYIELSSYVPSWGQTWVSVCISPTGTVELVPGIVDTFVTEEDIPSAPSADHWRLAAVKLRVGDTSITQTPYQQNIIDLRFAEVGFPRATGAGAGHDPVTLDEDLDTNLLGISGQELNLDSQPTGTVFIVDVSKPHFRALADGDIPDIHAHYPGSIELGDLEPKGAVDNQVLAFDPSAGWRPEFLDHGDLMGLSDDDHTQYMLSWGDVILVHSGATRTGVAYNDIPSAISAAVSGDVVLVGPGIFSDAVTMKSGVAVVGVSAYLTQITNTVTFSGTTTGARLESVSIVSTATAVVHSSSGANYLHNLYISASSGGASYAINQSAGTLVAIFCWLSAVGAPGNGWTCSGGSAYGYHSYITKAAQSGGGSFYVLNCSYLTSSGTLTYSSAQSILDAILTVDGAGTDLDADKLDGFQSTQVGAASSVVVTDSGGHIDLNTGDIYPRNDEAGLHYRRLATVYDLGLDEFASDTLDSGWSWAGSPFVTPSTVLLTAPSCLLIGGLGSASARAFLYRNTGSLPSSDILALVTVASTSANFAVGVRLDDGTDTNYAEWVLKLSGGAPQTFYLEKRISGAATATAAFILQYPPMLRLQYTGTKWTNWNVTPMLMTPWTYGVTWPVAATVGLTWTPSRWGLIFDQGGSAYASWQRFVVDWYGEQ
jgi:hypothetical protein